MSSRFAHQTSSLPLLIVLLCAGAIGFAQQPQSALTGQLPAVEFRAETNFVEINAVVTDERGDFVKDLTKDDFEIAEDVKPQTPSIFALVDLPTERAAKSGTSPTLRAALNSPLPVGSLPMRVFAAPFKGSGRDASVLVAVEIEGAAIKFNQAGGLFNGALEVSIAAVDKDAKLKGGDRQNLGLKLQPEMYERVKRTGLRFLSRITLPPARYQIRVGANESVGNGIGTVAYDLEVPDYSRTTFMLSGLALTSSSANAYVTTAPDPLLKHVLPPAPIATRAFDRQERLAAFVELYVTPGPVPSGVDFVATVRSAAKGRTIFSTRDTRALEASTRSLTHGFKAEVPLRDFTPGMYVLRVEATSTAKGQSIYREIPFEVL